MKARERTLRVQQWLVEERREKLEQLNQLTRQLKREASDLAQAIDSNELETRALETARDRHRKISSSIEELEAECTRALDELTRARGELKGLSNGVVAGAPRLARAIQILQPTPKAADTAPGDPDPQSGDQRRAG